MAEQNCFNSLWQVGDVTSDPISYTCVRTVIASHKNAFYLAPERPEARFQYLDKMIYKKNQIAFNLIKSMWQVSINTVLNGFE